MSVEGASRHPQRGEILGFRWPFSVAGAFGYTLLVSGQGNPFESNKAVNVDRNPKADMSSSCQSVERLRWHPHGT